VRAGETVLVHGDYDVDGMCSTALVVRVVRALGGSVELHDETLTVRLPG
jgi:single-stranded-DNA-specific exonuclease